MTTLSGAAEPHERSESPNASSDLVSWLRSQLDADEAIARAATVGPWEAAPDPFGGDLMVRTAWKRPTYAGGEPRAFGVITHGDFHSAVDEPDARHIAANDPAHVLRTVAAHRAILDRHSPEEDPDGSDDPAPFVCRRCVGKVLWYVHDLIREPWPCLDVRDLLWIYEDRPGFDPSWRADT